MLDGNNDCVCPVGSTYIDFLNDISRDTEYCGACDIAVMEARFS